MYLQHFQLEQAPFSLTPDTSKYCHLEQHEEAIRLLRYGLSQGESLMKVVGEVGLGKTLLCRQMLDALDDGYVTCYVFNPCLSGDDILRAVGNELGLSMPKKATRFALIESLSDDLLKRHEADKKVALIIDEAHLLTDESLEVLRLLTNLETESSKLLQIILVGQPELDSRLETPQLRQIQQRIIYSCYLKPMSSEHTPLYVMRRLLSAGHAHGQLFSRSAIKILNRYAGGVPRIINILCNKAMLIAFGQGRDRITRWDIKQAVIDSPGLIATRMYYRFSRRDIKRYALLAVASVISSAVLTGGIILWLQR